MLQPIKAKAMAKVAVGWNLAEEFLSKLFGLLSTLILTYLVAPESFGLIASIAVFLALTRFLVDAGFGEAIIKEHTLTEKTLSSIFWLNVTIGLVVFILFFLTAPYIAQIYELPKIKEILRFTMISIVAHSFCVVPYALIRRSLNFKKKFWIIMPSTAISYVIAVFVAFFGLSDWALPSQIVSQSLLALLLFYKLQNWTPQGYFSLKELNKIFKFSRDILIDSFLGILFKNIYLMIIPFLAPLSTVGLYFFAERLRDVYVSVFLSSIFKVTYPLMSIEKASGKNLVKSYREVLKMVLSISIPLTLTTIVLISPLFKLFIDDSWKGAIIFLEILIFGAIFFPLHALAHSSLLVAGKSGVALTVGILKKIIVLLALYVTWNEKFEVIIFGGVIASVISYLIHIWVNNKILGYSIKNQAFDLWQFFFPGILLIIFIIILQQIEFSIEYLLPEIFILIVIFFLLKIFFIQGFIEEWKKLYSLKADSSR